jgi:hypothetical protein
MIDSEGCLFMNAHLIDIFRSELMEDMPKHTMGRDSDTGNSL